jgi:hypothetical protein
MNINLVVGVDLNMIECILQKNELNLYLFHKHEICVMKCEMLQ